MTMAIQEPTRGMTLNDLLTTSSQAGFDGPGWIDDRRAAAADRFKSLGLPTLRDEEWRFTNLGPVAKTAFNAVTGPAPRIDVAAAGIPGLDGPRLVFVNGLYSADLSDLSGVPGKVTVSTFRDAAALQFGPRVHRGRGAQARVGQVDRVVEVVGEEGADRADVVVQLDQTRREPVVTDVFEIP